MALGEGILGDYSAYDGGFSGAYAAHDINHVTPGYGHVQAMNHHIVAAHYVSLFEYYEIVHFFVNNFLCKNT